MTRAFETHAANKTLFYIQFWVLNCEDRKQETYYVPTMHWTLSKTVDIIFQRKEERREVGKEGGIEGGRKLEDGIVISG